MKAKRKKIIGLIIAIVIIGVIVLAISKKKGWIGAKEAVKVSTELAEKGL